MAASGTRYSIESALKRGLLLENPFHRRTREAKAYDWLRTGLLDGQQWDDLPRRRKFRIHRAIMFHIWLSHADADAIAARRGPAQAERYLAYSNSADRIMAGLENTASQPARDIVSDLATLPRALKSTKTSVPVDETHPGVADEPTDHE